jgi:hypothetical protein
MNSNLNKRNIVSMKNKYLYSKIQKFYKNICLPFIVPSISIISLIISIFGVPFGKTVPLKPAGYSIIRDISSFPSDHLVLPIEWQNSQWRSVIIRQPYLILRLLNSSGQETNEFKFTLAGDYPEISTEAFKKEYRIRNAYILQPKSITSFIMIFHTQSWWDETNPGFRYRFYKDQKYHVYIGYIVNTKIYTEQLLFTMKIYRTVDKLDRKTMFWWDYWDMN